MPDQIDYEKEYLKLRVKELEDQVKDLTEKLVQTQLDESVQEGSDIVSNILNKYSGKTHRSCGGGGGSMQDMHC